MQREPVARSRDVAARAWAAAAGAAWKVGWQPALVMMGEGDGDERRVG